MTSASQQTSSAQTRYPVEPGQIWQTADGEHTFVCSDFMADSIFSDLVHSGLMPATLIYTDPPWGQGLLNGFRTGAQLPKATYDWTVIYRKIANLAAALDIPLFAECSTDGSSDGRRVPPSISEAGPVTAYWEIRYYRTHPCGLFYAANVPLPPGLPPLDGIDDDRIPERVLPAFAQRGLVLDPCAGQGVTSRAAQRCGWMSITNELNPRRMSAAMTRIKLPVGRIR
jgi:hypothetical protein